MNSLEFLARQLVAAISEGGPNAGSALFDLKQGEGGLVDLEFLLQFLVLRDAARAPALRVPRATAALLDAAHEVGALDAATHAALVQAHADLLDTGLRCTLDRRPRRAPNDARIVQARAAIRAAIDAQGLQFVDGGQAAGQ